MFYEVSSCHKIVLRLSVNLGPEFQTLVYTTKAGYIGQLLSVRPTCAAVISCIYYTWSHKYVIAGESTTFLLGRPTLAGKALSLTHKLSFFLFFSCLFLSIHHAEQPRSGWPSNVLQRFGCK